MDWNQALQKLQRPMFAGETPDEHGLRAIRAGSVCVASGKGGTGKSVVSASLSTWFAQRGRTLLFDADLGVGNAHILQDVHPERSLVDVVQGRAQVSDVVVSCGEGLDLIAAGSGYSCMASLSLDDRERVAAGLEAIESSYDFVVVDSAAGLSEQTIAFAAACDVVLLVTTPDVTAMTDAYAFLKVLSKCRTQALPLLAVNRACDAAEGARVATRLAEVAAKFLRRELRWIGVIPEDRAVGRSIAARRSVLAVEPCSEASAALSEVAAIVAEELGHAPRHGMGRSLLGSLLASDPG